MNNLHLLIIAIILVVGTYITYTNIKKMNDKINTLEEELKVQRERNRKLESLALKNGGGGRGSRSESFSNRGESTVNTSNTSSNTTNTTNTTMGASAPITNGTMNAMNANGLSNDIANTMIAHRGTVGVSTDGTVQYATEESQVTVSNGAQQQGVSGVHHLQNSYKNYNNNIISGDATDGDDESSSDSSSDDGEYSSSGDDSDSESEGSTGEIEVIKVSDANAQPHQQQQYHDLTQDSNNLDNLEPIDMGSSYEQVNVTATSEVDTKVEDDSNVTITQTQAQVVLPQSNPYQQPVTIEDEY